MLAEGERREYNHARSPENGARAICYWEGADRYNEFPPTT